MNSGSNDGELKELSAKLDIIIAFLVARGFAGDTSALVERLTNQSFSPSVIAIVSGLTENAVAIRQSRLRKKKQRTSTN